MKYYLGNIGSMVDSLSNYLAKKFGIDASYFMRGGFWLLLTQSIATICGLVATIIFTNLLSSTDFGVYRYILGLAAILAAFSLTGLGQSVFQTAAKNYTFFFKRSIRLSFLFSLSTVVVSGIVALYYFLNDNNTLALGALMIGIFVPLDIVFQNIFPFLHGRKRFRESAALRSIRSIVVTGASVGTLLITQDVLILVLVYLFVQALSVFVIYLFYRPKVTSETDETISKKYRSYAIHTSVRNFIVNVSFRADTIIVFQQLGATELAIYTVANLIPEQIKTSFKTLGILIIPKLAEMKKDDIHRIVLKRSFHLFLISILLTAVYIAASPFIYTLLFPSYPDAIVLSQLVALSFPAMVGILPLSALQSQMDEKSLYTINIVSSVLLLPLTFILTVQFGIVGTIWSRIIYRYLNTTLNFITMYRLKLK